MKPSEKVTLGVLGLMLLMWASVQAILFGPAFELNATTTAVIGLSLLLITRVLDWEDILKAKSAWDTLVWFAALMMVATFLGKLGLISWFSTSIKTSIGYLGLDWMSGTAILVAVYFYAYYFFASTTAHITAMFAAFLRPALRLGPHPCCLHWCSLFRHPS
jgi:DASS family divalent anion:Na+ symporter